MKITHDFHIHTNLSVCAVESATVVNYIERSRKMGLTKLGFADHFWDPAVGYCPNDFYKPQNWEHVQTLKAELEALKTEDLKFYFGCEAEYDPVNHGVGITEETAEKFDFMIVPNSHTHMMMPRELYHPYEKHVDFMVQAYKDIIESPVSKYITAMAHPFEAVCCPYDNSILINMISDDCFKYLFDRTAEKNIAVEINVAGMQRMSPEQVAECAQMRMFRLAKECGCKLIFGSDDHAAVQPDAYKHADLVANLLGLKDDDMAEITK